AVAVVLLFVPPGADAHLDPTAREHVDGGGDLCQVGRRSVGVAGAHLAQPDRAGHRAECGHHRPCLIGDVGGRVGHVFGRLGGLHGLSVVGAPALWPVVEVVVDPETLEATPFD